MMARYNYDLAVPVDLPKIVQYLSQMRYRRIKILINGHEKILDEKQMIIKNVCMYVLNKFFQL